MSVGQYKYKGVSKLAFDTRIFQKRTSMSYHIHERSKIHVPELSVVCTDHIRAISGHCRVLNCQQYDERP